MQSLQTFSFHLSSFVYQHHHCKSVDLRPQLCIKGEFRGYCLPHFSFCKSQLFFCCAWFPSFLALCFAKTWPDFYIPPTSPFWKKSLWLLWFLLSAEWIEIVRSVQNRHDSALTKRPSRVSSVDESMNLSSHLYALHFSFWFELCYPSKKRCDGWHEFCF